jgi:cold shock CspA family protein
MTVSMQASVAHMVAKLLARRVTPQNEIPIVMRTVEAALMGLAAPPVVAAEEPPTFVEDKPPPVRAPRSRQPRLRAVAAEPPPPSQPAEPPQPRLVRRAEIIHAAPHEEPVLPAIQHRGAVRGIVKWFDQRARRGALRLPGWSEEVAVDSALLDDMGITRLYKGQEIEAALSNDPTPRVVRLAIPGGVWQVHPSSGVVRNRNHARPVVVEMKRESLRRAAARVEAEQLLGPNRAR